MITAPPQLQANGNIYPSRFVMVDPSDNAKCIQATANAKVIGVSQVGTNYPPITDSSITVAGYAAIDGQNVELHTLGQVCHVEAGDVFAAGDYLKSDGDGKAIKIATTGTTLQRYGAQALEAATAAGQKIRCYIMPGSERPAIA
ncbi:capsid cement protein [Trichococcus shcherbakoviae]|uniref:capsid cement protein n=1 Tax=Trichococcus shcherbakoviae TaxID=2094020 RepID=UPI002AA6EFDC|nr:capsid cement protein [Trichococcus shcherbakoviae]